MIQVNYLSFDVKRIDFSFISLDMMKKIKKENKEKIKLKLLVSLWGEIVNNEQRWNDKYEELKSEGFDVELKISHGLDSEDYIKKIRLSVSTECEYSCKMDEDVLISNHTWDYIIENIEELNNKEILFISPIISNGIPSVDMFVSDFVEDETLKNEFYSLFKGTHIPNMWGANFSTLNIHTIGSKIWNPDNFYNEVNRIRHFYRGIHPVRISYESNYKLMDVITKNLGKIFHKQEYSLFNIKRPYYCNSFYFIRTEVWRGIVNDPSLFRDVFDEVPLNLYKDKHNLNMCFVKNGYCIHMSYNMIPNRYTIENEYVKKIREYI
jgi:hypothetical protein